MHAITLENTLRKHNLHFEQAGFTSIAKGLPPALCKQFLSQIQQRLAELITRHRCTDSEYFATVNRWPATALLDSSTLSQLIRRIQPIILNNIKLPLAPYEIDILYKSPLANLPTPCHQDIAYAFKQPYFASTWIALTEVGLLDSPLQFLPGSHHLPVSPAVDFWQPGYIDIYRDAVVWKDYAEVLPASCGDVILFSSRIWHASLAHSSLDTRLAIVIRWGNSDLVYPQIPKPRIAPFGMWNCGEYTAALLKAGFETITQQKHDSFMALIEAWQHLIQNKQVPFEYAENQALAALAQLRILHEAYSYYKGSDGQGIVYAGLWHSLLKYLRGYLQRLT